MKYLVELLKIIEGGLKCDKHKVYSYSELLANRLKSDGNEKDSERILSKIRNTENLGFTNNNLFLNNLPVDTESKMDLADVFNFKNGDKEIFLPEEDKKTIENFIEYIRSADKLISEGVNISPSLLLFGPSGCGKTELAYFIASELEIPIYTARSDTLISSYLGSTAKNIRQLFGHVSSRPCILFLDELDALAKVRDDQNELGELKRVVISLLQNIDSLDPHTILIGATNHEHLLDPAIWRRFTYKINLKYPDEIVRERLFRKYLKSYLLEKRIKTYIEISNGLSGAEIKQLAEDAIRNSIIKKLNKIDDIFLIKKLILLMNNDIKFNSSDIDSEIKKLRNLNPKAFTYEIMSELFNVSLGKISNIFK